MDVPYGRIAYYNLPRETITTQTEREVIDLEIE